jgi:hypothetical protein
MSETPEQLENDGGEKNSLSTVSDVLGDLVTGVPAPIRKNAFKAFNRLCTVAVEYPVALMEGAIAEKRAESKARVKLINASANQLAKQMRTDPEYVRAAASKFAHKIVRERVNIDQVAEIAGAELKSLPCPQNASEIETKAISDDWLNVFENEAAQMSSEEMQLLFGRILAGEIKQPQSFSIKTLKIIAQLDNRAAQVFRRFCSLSVSLRAHEIIDARVLSLGGYAASNTLLSYGLSFDALNALQEYGLIISDYNSYMDYQAAIPGDGYKVPLPLTFQNKRWGLAPKSSRSPSKELPLYGVALTRSGKELLSIVEVEPVEEYANALRVFFDSQGFIMAPISEGGGVPSSS